MHTPSKSLLSRLVDASSSSAADAPKLEDAPDEEQSEEGLGMSHQRFAEAFGFDPGAVREWELAPRGPESRARVVLTVHDQERDAPSAETELLTDQGLAD